MPLLGSGGRGGKMNFPLGHLTPQELQSKPRMAPSEVHPNERNPGARKRKSWEPRPGRITEEGSSSGTVCFQLHWVGPWKPWQRESWALGHCRLTSLLGSGSGLGWRWCSPSAECEQSKDLNTNTTSLEAPAGRSRELEIQSSRELQQGYTELRRGRGAEFHTTQSQDSSGKGILWQLFFFY